MELRDYQQQAVDDIRAAFAQGHRKVIFQLPTGGGKTPIVSHIIKQVHGRKLRTWAIAHRKELIYQLRDTLARFEVNSGIIMSGHDFTAHRSQVCSIQTLARRLHYPLWDKPKWQPTLIICDEAHHARSSTYQKAFNKFPNALILGVTATPCRTDGKGLGDVFNHMVCGPSISQLVEQGYLVPPKYFVSANVMGDHNVRKTAGDYNLSDLGEAVSETRLEGDLVREWLDKAQGLQTIVFAVNIEHSERIVNQYLGAGIPAAHIDCETHPDRRQEILAEFAAGRIKVLSNCSIVTEGFDVPACSCVQIARPTQSTSLYFQQVGRALRPAAGKSHAIVLDHAGVYEFHGNVLTPMHWTLAKTKPKEAQPNWLGDQEAVEPKPKPEKVITHNGEEVLIEVPYCADRAWLEELNRLNRLARERHYKKGWVAYRLRERFPVLSLEQYRVIAKTLGYHWRWADRQVEAQAS